MDFVTILGPTATGKTKLASQLAFHFNGEIISADSRQVYRSMNIGTGKDYNDYIISGTPIQYHLIDIRSPIDDFSVFDFQKSFYEIFDQITKRQKLPFLVGGSGMYLSSVLQNYNLRQVNFHSTIRSELEQKSVDELQQMLLTISAKLHNTTDLLDKERLIRAIIIAQTQLAAADKRSQLTSLNIGIAPPRSEIKDRITFRLKKRLNEGMIEEVKALLDKGITTERLNYFGLEYRYICLFLTGKLNYNDMFQKLNSAIHSFAKRQMTWFRKMEKEGVKIIWLNYADYDSAKNLIMQNYPVTKN